MCLAIDVITSPPVEQKNPTQVGKKQVNIDILLYFSTLGVRCRALALKDADELGMPSDGKEAVFGEVVLRKVHTPGPFLSAVSKTSNVFPHAFLHAPPLSPPNQ